MAVSNKSKIIIDVSLDENKVPEKLHWSAKDGGVENQQAKAMLLSVWDAKAKESMRIDSLAVASQTESSIAFAC